MEIDKVVNENGECFHGHNNTQQKKQVRRRLHTNKPYQERLMNMAEARKEIATALKFHRASMKQQQAAAANHHLQPPPPPEQGMSNSAIAATAITTTNYVGTYPTVYSWDISTFVPPPPPPMNLENLNLILPNQTLGLNLNFQDFNNLNTKIYYTPIMSSSSASSSSPSTSSSAAKAERAAGGGGGLQYAMETDEFEEIVEINSHEENDVVDHPFEQVMELPQWLINANEPSCFQDLYDHHLSHHYSPDPALPWLDSCSWPIFHK